MSDLEPLLQPAAWLELMARIRAHLEQGRPSSSTSRSPCLNRLRSAGTCRDPRAAMARVGRSYLAGSMRVVTADRGAHGAASELVGLRGAFEALPVAAALLDARAALLEANRQWHEFPAATTAQALARLRAANSQTAIEFWLDQGEEFDAGPRRLRVRAIAFQHEGARHLAVTLEDRRSD